ncbi:MAG: hypothetical protein K6D02_09190 [Lachnospiraceae bacterium]|nr:hypothetical protein [Lachnospiraceae bacterium]
MGELICSHCGQRLLENVKICPSCSHSMADSYIQKKEKDKLIAGVRESASEASYSFSDDVHEGFFIGKVELCFDRWLRVRGNDIYVYDKTGNLIIKDLISSFCLLWNDIRQEKNGDLHISIIIDHISLKGVDHLQIALNKSETSEDIFSLVKMFSEEVCDKMDMRIQKSFWKAIKYSMPEKKGEKKHKYKFFPTGKGNLH